MCGGLGYLTRRDDKGELFSRPCKCEIVRQNRRRIQRSGLGPLLDRCTFDAYQTPEPWQSKVLALARSFAAEHGDHWFFMGGSTGCGKTHLCTAVCAALMDAGLPVRYIRWRSEIPAIKAKVNDAEAYQDAIWPLKAVRVLYIDDFLKGAPSEGDRNIAFDLLDARYTRPDAITVISSELSIQRILDWDEAIGGRIAERSGRFLLNLKDKTNWRLNHTDER